jgi:ATP-dependent helicase HrpB
MASRQPLPIDPLLPEVVAAMARGNLVVVAEPGAGKTTRVPPALLELAGDRRIAVLEPRRIAARAAARRVADELGDRVGDTVGYEVRFERQVGADTRIVYLTEGLLARRLVSDPTLREVAIVLLDEFHERHLQSDLALALLRRAQQGPRPDLRIAVMSATIDPAPVAAFLGDCPIVAAAGRVHPVDIEHAAQPMRDPLEREVARALGRLLQTGLDGHVLVFLPGAGEIRRAMDACAELAARHDLLLLPLHGALPSAEQDRALARSERRKVVLATNVAETSLTIDGIAAVIDSGLARIARHEPWSGLGALRVEPVSRASCIQRAGRAGRTRAGRCVRLYTRHDFDSRREHEVPEIQRADLAEAVLALRAAGVARGQPFEWFDPPADAALAAADQLLARLGAVDRRTGALTSLGRQLEEMPVHPRQARVLVDAEARGAGADGALVAALLGERDVRLSRRGRGEAAHTSTSDVLDDLDALGAGDDRDLDRNAARAVRRAADQLGRFTSRTNRSSDPTAIDRALSIALLTGFPDRVARRRRPGAPDLLLSDGAGGGAAVLHPQSAVQTADLVLAIHAEESGRGKDRRVTIRAASAIEAAWLLELYTDDIADTDEVRFDPRLERVVRIRRLSYDGLVLEETIDHRGIDPAAAGPVLAAAARAAGLAAFVDPDALARLRARADFVSRTLPAAGIAAISDAELDELIAATRSTSFAELRAAHLIDQLRPHQRRDLDRLAPDAVALPGRRRVPVHYQPDRPPWIESRLQDFFGLTAGPAVAGGAVPLVLHLLAPNQRAVQVTSDLARFWQVHYPEIRRELARRYPRHAWPDDPAAARPISTGARRGRD